MKEIHGDWWPDRDRTCHCVAYKFQGADEAIALCKKTECVIQAGGNVGAWPRYLSKTFSSVWTFEPSKENYELMAMNLRGLPINAVYAALGSKRGTCSIKQNPTNCGDDRTIPGEEVEIIAIDDLGLSPDLIYLDIQGDELEAIDGGRQTIERCRPVIGLEIDKNVAKERGKGDPIPYMESLGYVKHSVVSQDWIFVPGEK